MFGRVYLENWLCHNLLADAMTKSYESNIFADISLHLVNARPYGILPKMTMVCLTSGDTCARKCAYEHTHISDGNFLVFKP